MISEKELIRMIRRKATANSFYVRKVRPKLSHTDGGLQEEGEDYYQLMENPEEGNREGDGSPSRFPLSPWPGKCFCLCALHMRYSDPKTFAELTDFRPCTCRDHETADDLNRTVHCGCPRHDVWPPGLPANVNQIVAVDHDEKQVHVTSKRNHTGTLKNSKAGRSTNVRRAAIQGDDDDDSSSEGSSDDNVAVSEEKDLDDISSDGSIRTVEESDEFIEDPKTAQKGKGKKIKRSHATSTSKKSHGGKYKHTDKMSVSERMTQSTAQGLPKKRNSQKMHASPEKRKGTNKKHGRISPQREEQETDSEEDLVPCDVTHDDTHDITSVSGTQRTHAKKTRPQRNKSNSLSDDAVFEDGTGAHIQKKKRKSAVRSQSEFIEEDSSSSRAVRTRTRSAVHLRQDDISKGAKGETRAKSVPSPSAAKKAYRRKRSSRK